MKAIEILSDTNIGGAGILLCNRLKHTDSKKIKTTVILPKNSRLRQRVLSLGCPVEELRYGADRSWSLLAFPSCFRLIRRLRPDLVNCHSSFVGRLAAKACGVPVVLYTHHSVFPLSRWDRSVIGRAMTRLSAVLLSDHCVAVAHAAKADLVQRGVPQGMISVIINGAEEIRPMSREQREKVRAEIGFSSDHFIVGICGRLERCKGHEDLIQCAQILLRNFLCFRFLVIGDGSQREALEGLCKERGVAPYFYFTGFAEDVSPYMNVIDLLVNCSRGTETSSLALSEAMSLGIPTIASRYGGNPYMVRDGENGYLYPVGNALRLADRIRVLYERQDLYQRMSDNAKRRFHEELNARAMAEKTNRLYMDLHRKRRG